MQHRFGVLRELKASIEGSSMVSLLVSAAFCCFSSAVGRVPLLKTRIYLVASAVGMRPPIAHAQGLAGAILFVPGMGDGWPADFCVDIVGMIMNLIMMMMTV